MVHVTYVAVGLAAGMFGGMFGVGGATVMIPSMVYFFGMTQHQAQGTSLAVLVFPVVLLGALRYYRAGNVNVEMAAFVCSGFFVGALFGAHAAHYVSEPLMKKLFGVFLLFVAGRMILT